MGGTLSEDGRMVRTGSRGVREAHLWYSAWWLSTIRVTDQVTRLSQCPASGKIVLPTSHNEHLQEL